MSGEGERCMHEREMRSCERWDWQLARALLVRLRLGWPRLFMKEAGCAGSLAFQHDAYSAGVLAGLVGAPAFLARAFPIFF